MFLRRSALFGIAAPVRLAWGQVPEKLRIRNISKIASLPGLGSSVLIAERFVRTNRLCSTSTVQIGDCELAVPPPKQPALVPIGYGLGDEEDQESLGHLRWMLQKFALGQDLFLLGGPGPRRRRLAFHICELAGLEVEYVRVTRDTTEADLKQRRDIVGKCQPTDVFH
jgi:hypothetical protein